MRPIVILTVVAALLAATHAASVSVLGIPSASIAGPTIVPTGSSATYIGAYRITSNTAPPAGQVVRLFDAGVIIASTTTSSSGAYSFTVSLSAGTHALRIEASGPGPLTGTSPTVNVRSVLPPGLPVGLAATQGPVMTDVKLAWAAPPPDDTTPVQSYDVLRWNGTAWNRLGTTTPSLRTFTIPYVPYDTEVTYGVLARNVAGSGPIAEITTTISEIPVDTVTVDRIGLGLCWYAASGNTQGCRSVAENEEFVYDPAVTAYFTASAVAFGRVLGGGLLSPQKMVTINTTAQIGSDPPVLDMESESSDSSGNWADGSYYFLWYAPPPSGVCRVWSFTVDASHLAIAGSRTSQFELCEG